MNLSSSDVSGGGRGSPSTIFLSGLIFLFTERVFSIKDPVSLKNFEQLPSAATRGQQTAQSLMLFQRKKFAGSLHHCGFVDRQSVCHNLEISLNQKRSAKKIQTSRFYHNSVKKKESDEVRWSQSWSKDVKFRKKPEWIYLKINKRPELKCVLYGGMMLQILYMLKWINHFHALK